MTSRLACIVLMSSAICSSASADEFALLRSNVDRLLGALHESGDFSGAVMIGINGVTAYEAAFGMADPNRPFTLDSAADGASLAKTVTAAVIWQLIGDGTLALDNPVNEHIADFPYDNVTIRHLLGHTAGLPGYDELRPLMDSGEPAGNAKLLEYMGATSPHPLHEPGSTFSYCDTCYDTLALLAERATGETFDDLAVKDCLGGLGAVSAFIRPVKFKDWRGPRTLGFQSSRQDAEIVDVYDNEAFYGGSNIYFTVRDLHSWAQAWVDDKALPRSVAKQAHQAAQIGAYDSSISLSNWYCKSEKDRCYYTGHLRGFFDFVYWDVSRRITVAFVSNNSMAPPLQPWLMRSLVDIAEGRSALGLPTVPAKEEVINIAAVRGRYRLPGLGDVQIEESQAGSTMRVNQGPLYGVFPVGYGTLYVPGKDAYLAFETSNDTASPSLIWSSVFVEFKGPRLQR